MDRPISLDRVTLENVINQIHGCTFATIDAVTKPDPTVTKVTTGRRVILFTNKRVNGYENIVRRHLVEAGKNPNNFVLGERPWGSRIPETPFVEHKGKLYLECIVLDDGQSKYFFLGQEVAPEEVKGLLLRREHTPQPGLSPEEAVKVCDYNIETISRIALMGKVLVAEPKLILPAPGMRV